MAFKLGGKSGPTMRRGQLKSPLSFKEGEDVSVPGTPVYRKDLGEGILGESNNDGSIFIHKDIQPGSEQERATVMHEMVHQTDIKIGKLAYDDKWIKWNGIKYQRENGKILYGDEWVSEGSKDFPWEKMPWDN